MSLTDRQIRERFFHDEYASTFDIDEEIDFESVDGPRSGRLRRPFNAYWALMEALINHYDRHSRTGPDRPSILDFGCGPGYYSILFARIGYRVEGFDISEASVDFALRRAAHLGFRDEINLVVGTGEQLAYRDESFDVVCGIDILHHLDDIPAAVAEAFRVLKPGGVAYFKEFFEAALYDRLRNSAVAKWLAPNTPSFDTYITEDERKLNAADIEQMRAVAPLLDVQYFRLITRLNRLIGLGDRTARLDSWLIDRITGLQRFCGEGIISIRKSSGEEQRRLC